MANNNIRLWERMERMEKKIDKILVSTSKNEEHLRQINGTLNRHEKELSNYELKINKLNTKIYYYLGIGVGAVSVIMFLINIVL